MIKVVTILFINLNFISCNMKANISDTSNNYFYKRNSTSLTANYITANYSISKGDFYTASQILNKDIENSELLKIKFFSNLASGKFETAYKISQNLKINEKNNTLYDLPEYILKIKNNDFERGLDVFKNKQLFFNLNDINYLIKLWIEKENKKPYLSKDTS